MTQQPDAPSYEEIEAYLFRIKWVPREEEWKRHFHCSRCGAEFHQDDVVSIEGDRFLCLSCDKAAPTQPLTESERMMGMTDMDFSSVERT